MSQSQPFDVYSEVTSRIIASLEAGTVPWRNPILGSGTDSLPRNLHSGHAYRGVNVFLLAITAFAEGYASPHWLTFNQARERGGTVRKGEKSSLVVFWKQYETEDRETGKPVRIPVLKHYRVFNAEQCDGIDAPAPVTPAVPFEPLAAAESIAAGYAGGPAVEHGGTQAFYRPSADLVRMPEPSRFAGAAEYYSTLFHELAHSTGHSSRLDRGADTEPKPFGSPDYSREELVAEMAAAFLSARVGISPAVIDNQAAYIGGWLKALCNDKRLVVVAAGAAQRAADWITGTRPTIQAENAQAPAR